IWKVRESLGQTLNHGEHAKGEAGSQNYGQRFRCTRTRPRRGIANVPNRIRIAQFNLEAFWRQMADDLSPGNKNFGTAIGVHVNFSLRFGIDRVAGSLPPPAREDSQYELASSPLALFHRQAANCL